MSITKVIIAKSTNTSPVAMVLAGPSREDMFMAMSLDVPRSRNGWVNSITDRMVGRKFTVLPTIVRDVSHIEEKHHEIWREHGGKFSADKYCEELYTVLLDYINDTFDIDESINDVIGEDPTITELIDFHQWTTVNKKLDTNKYSTINDLVEGENINKLVFSFEHREPNSYRDTWGWAIYDPSTQVVCVTYCPEAFFAHIAGCKCAYMGYLRLYTCIKSSDGIHCEANGKLLDSVLQELHTLETVDEQDSINIDKLLLT